MGSHGIGLVLLLLLAAAPATADEPFSHPVGGVGCETLARHAYDEVPALFVAGDPDSLLLLLDRWEATCGAHEVITRARILGAIWDGAFDESLYGAGIMADLLQRADELAAGPASDPGRARYDAFTVDLADQLLPHQPARSPEAFFCLFYGDRIAEAWALLETEEMAYTSLAYRFDLARDDAVFDSQWTLAGAFGSWDPRGDMAFAGTQAILGAHAGLRGPSVLLRLVAEWRTGRTDRPYIVTRDDGGDYLSDRWDAVLLGGELGLRIGASDGWELQLLGGGGVDMLRPFRSDGLWLESVNYSLGAGLRTRPGDGDAWIWGLDLRHEWVGDRPVTGDNLGGTAWSLRLVVERVFQRGGREARHLRP